MAKRMICEKAAECSLERRLDDSIQCPHSKQHHNNTEYLRAECIIAPCQTTYPGAVCKECDPKS